MAKKNNKAAKPSKSVKPVAAVKKAAPAAKAVANKDVKSKTAKPAPKKVVAAPKKAAPAKKASKPAAKNVPAKKAKPIVKTDKNNSKQTVNKKKPAPIAKKSAPAKKKEAPKKAPAKKAAPVVKKATVTKPAAKPAPKAPAKPVAKVAAKPAPKAPVKPVAKAPAKPAPVAKKAEPAKPVSAPKPADTVRKAPGGKKKTLTLSQVPVKAIPGAPRPMATPAARSTEKKPNVIIAHRRMENKSKQPGNGNTMITYQPETYRSILDEPKEQQGPAYRYSDEDLNEFRDIINQRLEAARKELNYLQGLITRKDEAGTEDTENRYMNMEDGSGAMEREQLAQLASRQIQFMSHLEKALVRIENKTYGICRVTGKLIDKARLRAVPHATLSIEAKKMMASKQN